MRKYSNLDDKYMQKLTSILLKIIGTILVIIGLIGAYYGPLEIYVFYLFSEGGRFFYDGFGIGSIWFAYLVVQNIGYYLVAAICIPIGYGHIYYRRWSLTLTQLFAWFWLGTGILIAGNLVIFIPQTFKLNINQEILITRLIIIITLLVISMILVPILVLRFYKGKKVVSTFEERDQNLYWTENYPFTLLALLLLFGIMILVMHITIFFQSIFPLFGEFFWRRQSVYLVSFCILVLGILTFGVIRLKIWAWWGSLVYLSLVSVSTIISFSKHSFYEIILMMNLPSYELELISELSLFHDFHLTGLLTPPLLVALGLLIYSKRYFGKTES